MQRQAVGSCPALSPVRHSVTAVFVRFGGRASVVLVLSSASPRLGRFEQNSLLSPFRGLPGDDARAPPEKPLLWVVDAKATTWHTITIVTRAPSYGLLAPVRKGALSGISPERLNAEALLVQPAAILRLVVAAHAVSFRGGSTSWSTGWPTTSRRPLIPAPVEIGDRRSQFSSKIK